MTRPGRVLKSGRLVQDCARRAQLEAMERKWLHALARISVLRLASRAVLSCLSVRRSTCQSELPADPAAEWLHPGSRHAILGSRSSVHVPSALDRGVREPGAALP